MEILHTTNEEPFVSGTGHFAGWENRLMNLEDTAILFCREGHAHIMIDLQEYELAPNTQVVLLPDTIVKFTNISPDFTISYIAFSRILFQEVTARLDLSFFRFLKENPCVTLPEERTRSINGLASGIEDLYHDRDNCFRQQILKNYIQSFLLDIYDKTHRLFLMKRPEGISRQEELFKRFIQLVHKHCTTQREVSFYANKLFITSQILIYCDTECDKHHRQKHHRQACHSGNQSVIEINELKRAGNIQSALLSGPVLLWALFQEAYGAVAFAV